jgi:hypothetical protein
MPKAETGRRSVKDVLAMALYVVFIAASALLVVTLVAALLAQVVV